MRLNVLYELFLFPPRLLPRNITFDNFRDLSELMSNSWIPFTRYFFNTILITVTGTVGHVLIASMAAFPLAKYKFPGRTIIFTLVVYSLMFAPQVTATPNYIIVSWIWFSRYANGNYFSSDCFVIRFIFDETIYGTNPNGIN